MPPRIARVRMNRLNSASPSPQRIARASAETSSLKRPSISKTASLLCRNTSRHMVGSDAAMRHVAGDREDKIVMLRRHGLDAGAERAPEGGKPLDCLRVGIFRRREDAP